MKKKILSKLLKIISLKDTTSQPKAIPKDTKPAPRKRCKSSQSSTLSNYEPMPTIYEETETEWLMQQPDLNLMMNAQLGQEMTTELDTMESVSNPKQHLAWIPTPTFQIGAILILTPPFVEL